MDWVLWLTPVILDTWEEIRRPKIQGQSAQKSKTLSRKQNKTKKPLGVMAYACHPCYLGSINRRITIQAIPGKNVRPYLKNNHSKKRLEIWLKLESLPSKTKTLSSNPSTTTTKSQTKTKSHNMISASSKKGLMGSVGSLVGSAECFCISIMSYRLASLYLSCLILSRSHYLSEPF
jgi:hypothetical protein